MKNIVRFIYMSFFNESLKKPPLLSQILSCIRSSYVQNEWPSLVFTSDKICHIWHNRYIQKYGLHMHMHVIFHFAWIFRQENLYKLHFSNYWRHTITVWVVTWLSDNISNVKLFDLRVILFSLLWTMTVIIDWPVNAAGWPLLPFRN